MKKCPNCKLKTDKKDANFCPKCGSPLIKDYTVTAALSVAFTFVIFAVIFVPRIIKSVNTTLCDCGTGLNTTISMNWQQNNQYNYNSEDYSSIEVNDN